NQSITHEHTQTHSPTKTFSYSHFLTHTHPHTHTHTHPCALCWTPLVPYRVSPTRCEPDAINVRVMNDFHFSTSLLLYLSPPLPLLSSPLPSSTSPLSSTSPSRDPHQIGSA